MDLHDSTKFRVTDDKCIALPAQGRVTQMVSRGNKLYHSCDAIDHTSYDQVRRYHPLSISGGGGCGVERDADWDREVVRAVDLDLDLIRRATGIIDDEDEFELHIDRFGYPKELIDRCRSELQRLRIAMDERRGILSDHIFDWSPAAKVDETLLKAV